MGSRAKYWVTEELILGECSVRDKSSSSPNPPASKLAFKKPEGNPSTSLRQALGTGLVAGTCHLEAGGFLKEKVK